MLTLNIDYVGYGTDYTDSTHDYTDKYETCICVISLLIGVIIYQSHQSF